MSEEIRACPDCGRPMEPAVDTLPTANEWLCRHCDRFFGFTVFDPSLDWEYANRDPEAT